MLLVDAQAARDSLGCSGAPAVTIVLGPGQAPPSPLIHHSFWRRVSSRTALFRARGDKLDRKTDSRKSFQRIKSWTPKISSRTIPQLRYIEENSLERGMAEDHHDAEFWKATCKKENIAISAPNSFRNHQRFSSPGRYGTPSSGVSSQTVKDFWAHGLMGVYTAEPGRPCSPYNRRRATSSSGRSPRRQGPPTHAAER